MNLWQKLKRKFKENVTLHRVSVTCALLTAAYYIMKARKLQLMPQVKLSYFLQALKSNLVSEIVYDGTSLLFRGYNNDLWYQTNSTLLTKDRIYKIISKKPELSFSSIQEKNVSAGQAYQFVMIAWSIGILAGMVIANAYMRTKQVNSKGTGVTFSSIYGLEQAKKQLGEIIDYLIDPTKYKQIGARLRRGIMIYGPPGTGKTMLAKATATESKVSFIYCSATEFMEMYVGLGAKRVRELFANARKQSPAIIFIDEIDSIAYKRRNQNFNQEQASEGERINTLNQLLTEIDGFNESENIVVIAATNRISVIDDALMRSGRFDIKIQIKLPTQEERLGILRIHLEKKKHECSEDAIKAVSQKSENCSGADMENIANESAYLAIQQNRATINNQDLFNSLIKLVEEKQSSQQQQGYLMQD